MIKGPAFMSLDYSKWYTMEVTFQIISNQLYMVSGSLDDGTKKEPLGSMIRIGNALQMGWLDSVVLVSGVDDMVSDLVSIKKRCVGCVVEDSLIFDMLPKFFTKTAYSGSTSQGQTNFANLKTPFALECISSNDACFATAKACYASAPNRNTIYFAGDAPIPQGYSSTSVVTKQTYNILEGPLTIRASFYNRSNAPEYNESWFSILPANYKYYCSPVLVPTASRQGVRVGGWPTQTIIVDSRSETVDENIIEPFKIHNISNWGKWYEARVVWDTANGMFRCAEYSINAGSGWVKVWNTPIDIGPVSNFPWLNSVRMSILGDDMIDSIGFLKIHCVSLPKQTCTIVKSARSFCRTQGQYNVESSFTVNGSQPIGASYKIIAFNGNRNHPNLSNYSLVSGQMMNLNWPGGTWQILITSNCGSKDSTTITLRNEPIVAAYAKDTQRICSSEKIKPLLLFIDSTSVTGGNWIWSGSLVSGNTINVNRSSDSIFSYPRLVTGIYTSPLGCKDTVNIQVLVRNNPTITITGGDTQRLCEKMPAALNVAASATTTMNWLVLPPSDGTLSNYSGSTSTYTGGNMDFSSGQAWLQVRTTPAYQDPCPAAMDTIIVFYFKEPIPFISDSIRVCQPARVILNGSELSGIPPQHLQYTWTLSTGSTQNGISFNDTFPNSGIFNLALRITDTRSSCSKQIDKLGAIHIYPTPVAEFDITPSAVQTLPNSLFTFTNKSSLNLSVFPNGTYASQWNFSDNKGFTQVSNQKDPQFQAPNDTNSYRIKLLVISDKNCRDSAIKTVYLVNKFNFHAPSAFCPQGINSRYRIEAGNYQSAIIRIYSRWGEKLYESENLNEGWDGMYMGLPCQEGVYVVVADLRSFDGYHNIYEGTFHLLR
jgi:gliding motility-associated-like protein